MSQQGSTKNLKREVAKRQRSDLPYGMVTALRGLSHRVPSAAPPELHAIADRALERLVNVMEGKVSHRQAPSTVKACEMIRNEICGPIAKDINVKATLSHETLVARAAALIEQGDLDDGS